MKWPSRSPDLNLIENIWKIVKDNIQSCEDFPRDADQLKIALKEEWARVDKSVFRVVVDSVPRRIEEVAAAEGHSCRY